MPAECSDGTSFDERTVIRTYKFVNALTDETLGECPQTITYETDGCTQLTSFGFISIAGDTEISVPGGTCDIPLIEVSSPETGICGYVEYMWLVSNQVNALGLPIIPTNFNVGTIWNIIPGEVSPTLDPGLISEDTYYVRCARNFSCCDFGESNIISVLIDENAICPAVTAMESREDCESIFTLRSPTDDFNNAEQIRFITDQTIDASNIINPQSRIIFDAAQGSFIKSGFEIKLNAKLEIYNTGCPK